MKFSRINDQWKIEISKHRTEDLFKKYRKLCKIEDFTPYITRRTFCTRLGERGVIPKVLSKMALRKKASRALQDGITSLPPCQKSGGPIKSPDKLVE